VGIATTHWIRDLIACRGVVIYPSTTSSRGCPAGNGIFEGVVAATRDGNGVNPVPVGISSFRQSHYLRLLSFIKIMKLAVAVGILTANSLPAVVSEATFKTSEKRRSSDGQQVWWTSKKEDLLVALGSTKSNELLDLRPTGRFMNVGASWKRSSSRRGSTIDLITTDVECIPDADASEADVGALGCGSGQICVSSVDSRLGGLCMDTTPLTGRRMKTGTRMDVCDTTSSYFEFYQDDNCDCSSFDMTSKTGSISCSQGPYCLGTLYYGCYSTCLSITQVHSYVNGESISLEECDELVADGDVASASSLCTNYSADDGTCETKLDGQTCTSCTTEFPGGFSFDCSNVADGVKVERENIYARFANLPIIQACHGPVDGTYCNLCGVDYGIDVLNNTTETTVISLDGFGDALTCLGLYQANFYNQITSDKCIEASAVAKAECCVDMWYVQWMDMDTSWQNL
jgi:hypothetical protein